MFKKFRVGVSAGILALGAIGFSGSAQAFLTDEAVPDPSVSGSTQTHAFWFSSSSDDKLFYCNANCSGTTYHSRWIFDPSINNGMGELTDIGNNMLLLTGRIVNSLFDELKFDVSVKLNKVNMPANPKLDLFNSAYVPPFGNGGPADPDLWMYYDIDPNNSTMTGVGATAGITFDLEQRGPSGSLGVGSAGNPGLGGANNKNLNDGFSTWLTAIRTSNDKFAWANGKDFKFAWDSIGDINIDVKPNGGTGISAPATFGLFSIGLGLIGLRRRRNEAAA